MTGRFLQTEVGEQSLGQLLFYGIIIGLGLYLYFKMRNKNARK